MTSENLPGVEILLVEDDSSTRAGLAQIIHAWGASHVWEADSGRSALRLLKKHPSVQIIVTDILMPEGGGLPFTQQVKKLRPEIPVIVLSAVASFGSAQEFLRLGVLDYLNKPVNLNELKLALQKSARLLGNATLAGRVFLSYAREDQNLVSVLYKRLKRTGFDPWMDSYDLVGGQPWKTAIRRAIKESRFFLACLSERSISKRGTVQEELRIAIEVAKTIPPTDTYLIPLRLEECVIPDELTEFHWVDMFQNDGWDQLRQAIQLGLAHRSRQRLE